MAYDRFKDSRYVKWAKFVKVRDNFTCQICGREGVYLNSHHIESYDVHIEKRFDIYNGITLCNHCHSMFHSIYKSGNNTEAQFLEFKKIMSVVLKFYRQKKEIIKVS